MDFEHLATARHSAVNFEKDFKMTEADFEKIFNLTKTAPSAYNLQFTNYLVVMDDDKKERVRALNYEQYKIHSASAAVIVMGNRQGIEMENAEKIYGPMKMLKMMDEHTYDMTMDLIRGYSEGLKTNNTLVREEIIRNSGLHAMLFMLAAKHYGFDTCPMHIHNVADLKKEFNIPDHLEPIMLITIGKSVDKIRPRGYRKPVGEFVQFNSF
ncbi:nitroreductase family protein [Solibacillus sp. MA9]|uniref:Nitroreductase family protein n=1 Tax=Solibacillus palustris TaxID=2908203 RepID=A0ABS9UE04_9BACL|nr:nitroreductase family protein [Solibacillus sp. MA9]MCH7322572.1 nitroreductase family protein [Solibacillus sp. MA9]